ncbi:MAG: hypothetical protein K0Q95_2101 [Bacteroidota bacterium]|jgi:hypothetical protein|nr:hypothetical protein [Bacteroidota bacterium]
MKRLFLLLVMLLPLLSTGAIDDYTNYEDFNEDPFGIHWIVWVFAIIWAFYTFVNKDKNS